MKRIAYMCFCCFLGILQLAFGAGVQFCANDLQGTEIGAEEHYLNIYYRDVAGKLVTKETEAYNMAGDKGFRCWGVQFDLLPYISNRQLKVEIWESDEDNFLFGKDDYLDVVYVNSDEVLRTGLVTLPVNSGGFLQFKRI